MGKPPALYLDLSTRIGWALHPGGIEMLGARFRFGFWELDGGMDDPAWSWAGCLDALAEAHAVFSFDRLVIEAPLPAFSQTRQKFAVLAMGLAHMCAVFAWRREIAFRQINAGTVRAAILKNGHAKKPEIVGWCRSRGYDVTDHNAADALLLGHYDVAPAAHAWPPQHKARALTP